MKKNCHFDVFNTLAIWKLTIIAACRIEPVNRIQESIGWMGPCQLDQE